MEDVMVDIETLGTKPGCMLLSVGAVYFDPHSKSMGKEFYQNIKLDEQAESEKFHMDPDTVEWWLKQSDSSREKLFKNSQPIGAVMREFTQYFNDSGVKIWSHGSNFDISILEYTLNTCMISVPWQFWNVRDTRTLFDATDCHPDRDQGNHHYALDDAINQARAVQKAYTKILRKPSDLKWTEG